MRCAVRGEAKPPVFEGVPLMINSLFLLSFSSTDLFILLSFPSQLEQWEGFEAGDVITLESSLSPL